MSYQVVWKSSSRTSSTELNVLFNRYFLILKYKTFDTFYIKLCGCLLYNVEDAWLAFFT